jgi:hypothetical protein
MTNIEDIKDEYSVEIALIILTCRVYFKTVDESQIDEYIKKYAINWEDFLRSCSLHRIRPIVYKTILSASIPHDIKEFMKEKLVSLSAKSWNLVFETERIITLLKAKNIKVLPYKGSAFSKQFYGDLTSRESSDIDLTIRKEDFDGVISIMEADGYMTDNKVYNYLGSQFFEEYKDLCFNKYKNRTRLFHVEFHWAVAERSFSIDKQGESLFRKEGSEINLLRESVIPLAINEHFVAQLINHVWRDVLKDIKALIDMATCIQNRFGLLNWPEIDLSVENLRLKKGFDVSLLLTDQLLGVKNNNYSSYPVSKKVINRFKKSLLRPNPTRRIPSRSKTFILCQLSLRENKYDKLIFLKEFLRNCFYPTELDFELIRLPKQLFFIYPILKPIRYLFKQTDSFELKKKLIPDE